jgi:hypothetical protein
MPMHWQVARFPSQILASLQRRLLLVSFSGFFAPVSPYLDVCTQLSVCASVFMVVALSFERHFAICSPHAYRIHLRTTDRWKHLTMYIVPVIGLSLFLNIPMFVNLQVKLLKKVHRSDACRLSIDYRRI